jgi:hypothetical protein
MIQTKFDAVIKADKYHGQFALNKRGQIGRLQLWAWNNCYRFLNFETGKSTTYAMTRFMCDKPSGFTILTNDEWTKLYREKNEPKELFEKVNENYKRFIGDRTKYTERQITYGIIHDNLLHLGEKETNKYWSVEFCEAIAWIISQYNFYAESMRIYGSVEKMKQDEEGCRRLVNKYLISGDLTDMYAVKLKEMGRFDCEPKISEEKICQSIKKVYNLPDEYRKSIMSSTIVKAAKKEITFYENFK